MKYCSLGENCLTSYFLKRAGLKNESHPFDWMFSSPEMVRHCIEDDFKTFLDKSQYKRIVYKVDGVPDEILTGHNHYEKMINNQQPLPEWRNIVFQHHDVLTNEEHYQYFERCIDRFRSLLKSDEEKTFVLSFRNRSPKYMDSLHKTLLLSFFLEKYTKNYKLVAIYNTFGAKNEYSVIEDYNLKFINFTTTSHTLGQTFLNESDNEFLSKILIDNI